MAPHRDVAAWCEDRGRNRAPSVIPTRHGPVLYDRNDFDLGVALTVANIEDIADRIKATAQRFRDKR